MTTPTSTKNWLINLLKGGFHIGKQIIAILLLIVILLAPLVYLFTMPVATQIQAELVVDRISFQVNERTELANSIKFHSATITEFKEIQFTPEEMPSVNSDKLDTIRITGFDEDWPTVAIETATPSTKDFGELSELSIAKHSEITFSVEPSENLLQITINSSSEPSTASLLHVSPFQVITQGSEIQGMSLPSNFSVTRLSEYDSPFIEVTGQKNALGLNLSLVDVQDTGIVMKSQVVDENYVVIPKGISITELNLLREEMIGDKFVRRTAVKKGEVRYPAYPNIEPIHFGESNFLFFDDMKNFYVEKIVYSPQEQGFKVSVSGLAESSVRTYPQGFPDNEREYRLTYADKIVNAGKFYQLMFTMLLWIIPIIIGVVGIVSITKIKLSDADIDKIAEKLRIRNE